MKAAELAAKMRESGTGESKLEAALRIVAGKKNPQGIDLLRALHDLGHVGSAKKGAAMIGLKDFPDSAPPVEIKNLVDRLAEVERERDELRERVSKLEVQTLGPKAV